MAFLCRNINKSFSSRQGDVVALGGINFAVNDQEFVCIVGPSGCGKTTLLKIIAGLVRPSSGKVKFSAPIPQGQLRTSMVFQDLGLFPWMSVLENVAFGLEAQGFTRRECHRQASEFLGRVGLGGFIHNYPRELSGGMRQRVAILRAFLSNAQILLMDEPFGSLDSQTRLVMQEELLRIWKENRRTVVYVTHDIEEAILLGDRVLVMSGRPGCIQKDIPIPLERPRHLADKNHPDVVKIQVQIWKILEDEVRRDLSIVS